MDNDYGYKGYYPYYSKSKNDFIFIPPKGEDLLLRLKIILEQEGLSEEYQKRIIKIFQGFIKYNELKKPNSTLSKNDFDVEKKYIIKRIKISDIYDYITLNDKYKNINTKKFILSRIKKFIRMLNVEPTLNYKKRINYDNKNNKDLEIIDENVIKKIILYLKEKETPQLLLIFYFLYFAGFTYSNISRITIKDFKKGFKALNLKKGRSMKREIHPIITKILISFFENKGNVSKYFFYDSFEDTKIFTRAKLIKNNIESVFKEMGFISFEKINDIVKFFSKSRKSKKLTSKYLYLFDNDLNLQNILNKKENSSNDEDISDLHSKSFGNNNYDFKEINFNVNFCFSINDTFNIGKINNDHDYSLLSSIEKNDSSDFEDFPFNKDIFQKKYK